MLKKIGLIATKTLLFFIFSIITIWICLALYYSELEHYAPLNAILMMVFALASLSAGLSTLFKKYRRQAFAVYGLMILAWMVWWTSLEPSNDRDWQTDVAKLAWAETQGNSVKVHNIRNFDYRTETDYSVRYYDKTYDLSQLKSVDLVAVYWMGPAIAHTFLSFGFENGEYLAISIETRKEKSESYSTIKGFFKQYELYYVVADERDVIRLRTNYRENPPEQVYIYRTQGPIENGRKLFLQYINRINKLKEKPEFYNTLTDNCTTGIWMNSIINPEHVPLSLKILVSGYLPEYLHEVGKLDSSLPFADLQNLSLINKRAQNADQSEDFSALIRADMPGMSQN